AASAAAAQHERVLRAQRSRAADDAAQRVEQEDRGAAESHDGRYFAGIGLSGRSESQNTVTTHHRLPSWKSWMLLIPRMNGAASSALRRDSYVLNACSTCPNCSLTRCVSISKKPSRSSTGPLVVM